MPPETGSRSVVRAALVVILAGMLTVTLQQWTGSLSIYSDALAEKRLMLHDAILHNRRPPEGWHEFGADRTNVRILTVYLAQGLHRATGASVLTTYRLIETIALFGVFLALFAYVRRWVLPSLALVGLLYFAFVTTLTYHFQFFHPWDRPSLLCWIIGAMFIRDNRFVPLMLLLPIAVTVKWDIIVLPCLYWLTHCSRDSFRSVTLRTLALGAVAIATLVVLAKCFPGGADRLETGSLWDITRWQLSHNWQQFLALRVSYPPLFAFGLPLAFASYGFRLASRFLRVSCLFGVALFIPLGLNSHFVETRAQMMILALLLPTALVGLARFLEPDQSSRSASVEDLQPRF